MLCSYNYKKYWFSGELDESPCPSPPSIVHRTKPNFRQRKSRRSVLSAEDLPRVIPENTENTGSCHPSTRHRYTCF